MLEEIRRNLSKKIKLDQQTVIGIDRLLRENGVIIEPAVVSDDACRDAADLHVLGLAETGQADYLITGDEDLLVLGQFGSCKIVTPRQFWSRIRQQ